MVFLMSIDSNNFSSLKKDNSGQLSIEYILIVGFMFVISLFIIFQAGDAQELNTAMAAARSGALDGANMDSFAIYPKVTFDEYTTEHSRLTSQSNVKIVRVDYTNFGYNSTYKKIKIQLKIWASSPSVQNPADKNCLGDRMNYNVRKNICEAFKTQNLTNAVFNPAFSNRYVFTTSDVKWV